MLPCWTSILAARPPSPLHWNCGRDAPLLLSSRVIRAHPPGFNGAPMLLKPARPEDLVELLYKCMGESAAG